MMRSKRILIIGGLAISGAPLPEAGAKQFKPPPPPIITTTAEVAEYQAAQVALSRFISALQQGRRAKAASLMSSRVTQAERDAMIRKEWLRYDPKDRKNVMQVLYWRDLQIHTQRIYKEGAELAVVSRTIALKPKPKGAPSGVFKVRMRKEAGSWRVELHQPRVARK